MKRIALIAALPLCLAVTASAQHSGHSTLPPPSSKPSVPTGEAAQPSDESTPAMDHGQMDNSQTPSGSEPSDEAMPGMDHGQMDNSPGASEPQDESMPGMDHGQMDRSQMPASEERVGNEPPPEPPADHAADRIFDPGVMEAARAQLREEHGGEKSRMLLLNLGEYQIRNGEDGYRWDGEAWYGGDLHRLVIKTEGEGGNKSGVETAEVQALYSRAIGPYFDLQAGIRYDFEPNPSRVYATIGVEGLAPYWFDIDTAVFLSNKGDVLGRLDASYDLSLTQRWILQPRAEINLAAQDIPEIGIGSGISNLELGLRLRYEIRREFAPYIGISFERKFGGTADFARQHGDNAEQTSVVVGVRTWF